MIEVFGADLNYLIQNSFELCKSMMTLINKVKNIPIQIGLLPFYVNRIYWVKSKPGRKRETIFIRPFS